MAAEILVDAITAITSNGKKFPLPLLRDGRRDCPNGGYWSVLVGMDRPFTDLAVLGDVAVVADGSGLFWSRDGRSWTPAEGVEGTRRVEVVEDRWFASGTGAMYTSLDGVTWTQTNLSPYLRDPGMIRKLRGQFLLLSCGDRLEPYPGDELWSSPDGVTWTRRLKAGVLLCTLCPAGDGMLAMGGWDYPSPTAPKFFWSADGLTWTERQMDGPYNIRGTCSAREKLVAVGSSGIWWSDDGFNWTRCPETAGRGFLHVKRLSRGWLAYGERSIWIEPGEDPMEMASPYAVWSSPDGMHWEPVPKYRGYVSVAVESQGRFMIADGVPQYASVQSSDVDGVIYMADGAWRYAPFGATPYGVRQLCAFKNVLLAAAETGLWISQVWRD